MTKRTSQNDSGCVEFLRNAVKTLGDLSKDGGPSPRNITLAYETASGVLREIERLRGLIKRMALDGWTALTPAERDAIQLIAGSSDEPLENQNGGG